MGNKWVTYSSEVNQGKPHAQVLDALGLKRYCCRSMLLTHVDILDKILLSQRQGSASIPAQSMSLE
jgi:DNA-directed RNA polymerase subunit N (RpoN/RPB10)